AVAARCFAVVLLPLRSPGDSSGRNPAGAVCFVNIDHFTTFGRFARDFSNSVTCACADGERSCMASSIVAGFFFFAGSVMALTRPKRILPLSPASSSALIRSASVASQRQKITELFDLFTAFTTAHMG